MNLLQSIADGLIAGSLIALAAVGISLVFAVQRFANVSQSGLMTAGGYFALAASGLGLPFGIAVLAAIAGGAALGALLFLLVFRQFRGTSRVTLLVVSIGVDLILRNVIGIIWGSDIKGYPVPNFGSVSVLGVMVSVRGLGIALVSLLVMLVVWVLVQKTRLGSEMRATADLPDLSRLFGVSATRVNLFVWMTTGVVAAIAGVCIGLQSSLTPELGWHILLSAFAATILGGMGDIRGAVLGGFVMGLVSELSTLVLPSTFKPVVAFVVIVLMLLLRPNGLMGKAARV